MPLLTQLPTPWPMLYIIQLLPTLLPTQWPMPLLTQLPTPWPMPSTTQLLLTPLLTQSLMQLPTPLSLTPLLMPQLSMLLPHTNLPLLTSLPLMLNLRARMSLIPTSTESLMTTQRPTSTLLRLPTVRVLSPDPTPLLFPMAVPSTSSTPLTTTTDMLLRSLTKESQCTPKPSPTNQPLPPPIMPKPSNQPLPP